MPNNPELPISLIVFRLFRSENLCLCGKFTFVEEMQDVDEKPYAPDRLPISGHLEVIALLAQRHKRNKDMCQMEGRLHFCRTFAYA
ncbi:hypothetical protein PoB_002309700 [Plakobranchus ocellatus]|uniref:Uncharacterized protein n=1 Tax=Plakobranchus ocellatus TaxID=259542 RepID=A0AAV3ZQ13_9GAST|nr:hypothetical protein PoB_002309700 [Plakobranchus ocellatus]